MNLRDAAQEYLKESPAEWLAFAKALAADASRDIAAKMSIGASDMDPDTFASVLAETFLSVLVAPANLFLIAGSKDDKEARLEVARCLSTSADDSAAAAGLAVEEAYWGDIMDVAADGEGGSFPIRRWWAWDDYWDDAPMLSVRHAVRGHLRPQGLKKLIGSVSVRVSQAPPPNPADLFRLDVIDFNLYRALLAHPELLKTLNWRAFENLLADALETFGYQVELQRGTKDGGVDIFAVRSDRLGPHRYILQAKRWSHRVSVEPVRQLLFVQSHHRATKACLATTSSFTQGAWALASQYRWQLDLRDFDGLQDWIREAARLKGVHS